MLRNPAISAVSAAALMLAACASQQPAFSQHSYRELGYDPRLASEMGAASARPHLIARSGFPHVSDTTRDLASAVNVIPALNSELGFQSDTGELTNPGVGFLVGAAGGFGVGAEIIGSGSCTGDATGCAIVAVVGVGVLVITTAGGALLGVFGAEANRQEEAARRQFVQDIQANLGDVQPTEMLARAVSARLSRIRAVAAAPDPNVQATSNLHGDEIAAAPREGRVVWRVGEVLVDPPLPEEATLLNSEFMVESLRDNESALIVAMPHVGLLPVQGAGRGSYSMVALAEMALAIELPDGYVPHADEAVLTIEADGGSARYAVIWRRVPLILPSRPFEEWSENSAALFVIELDRAVESVAERVTEYAFLLWREEAEVGVQPQRVAATNPQNRMARPGDDIMWALNPFDLSPRPPSEDRARHDNGCRSARARTSGQTFEWTAFEAPVEDRVTYDFRLYDDGLREVYRANGLTQPRLTLPIRLERNGFFYWTARARLWDGGRERITDWAICGDARTPLPFRDDLRFTEFYPIHTGL